MKKIVLLLVFTPLAFNNFAQQSVLSDDIVRLARIYKDYMFMADAPQEVHSELEQITSPELAGALHFVSECITANNNICSPEFITRPDTGTLRMLYIVVHINYNMVDEHPRDNHALADSLLRISISLPLCVHQYYSTVFTAVSNKNKPFDLSQVNFDLEKLNLTDDAQKGIFFLECMEMCNTMIWGYMNIVHPPNTKEAFKYINKYPAFNSLPYFYFADLDFPDFNFEMDDSLQSYKNYYIDKYYQLLLSHLICLQKNHKPDEDINKLILGSLLRDERYYHYSSYNDLLEQLFTEVKK